MNASERSERIVLRLGRDGSLQTPYEEGAVLEALLREAEEAVSIRRASRVEPSEELSEAALRRLKQQGRPVRPGQWWADMSPVGGPILGPFATRTAALREEKSWLLKELRRTRPSS